MRNSIFQDIRNIFQNPAERVTQIILLNVLVFITAHLVKAVAFIGGFSMPLLDFLALPANIKDFLLRPWTIITYMFFHLGFFHILFNMLWLHWMGRIVSEYIGSQKFLSIYVLGGIAGGLLYLLFFNLFGNSSPSFYLNTRLLGASGAVMAVVFAAATLLPNYTMHLMFIGPVRLKYIALGALVITTLVDFSVNTGGKLAHLGGAAFGFVFIKQLQKGNDWSKWFLVPFTKLQNLFKKKPKIKVKHKKSSSNSYTFHRKPTENEQEIIDAILDKIAKSGYDSLTQKEKDFLFRYSQKK
ncbi:MAG: rhomboid family intramembrane serine protease [Bacteroidetes bacterium]|nr:MAG: rhomboid family intramembrane serine protease [Bacteroidota bacterium]